MLSLTCLSLARVFSLFGRKESISDNESFVGGIFQTYFGHCLVSWLAELLCAPHCLTSLMRRWRHLGSVVGDTGSMGQQRQLRQQRQLPLSRDSQPIYDDIVRGCGSGPPVAVTFWTRDIQLQTSLDLLHGLHARKIIR